MTSGSKGTKIQVLLIDDDEKLCRLVKDYLDPLGYNVSFCYEGAEGLLKALSGDYHVVILDVMLPGMDGFDVLRAIRRESDVPVLMLTARGDETDRIVGLEIGADDYLPKTFSTRELLARLRAVTRRSQPSARKGLHMEELPFLAGEIRIDPAAHSVFVENREIDLTPIEFDLLTMLARRPGRVFTRNELLDRVAGRDYEVFDRAIDVHVSSIRRKLGDDSRTPRFIKTIRSAGYVFLDPSQKRP
ncbi:MAG: response regulator transcription factor [Acidobacteriota bacterium]